MAANALAQEKVWIDKSAYDKAECLHHEKLSMVQPHKIMDDTKNSQNIASSNEQTIISTNSAPKSKSKKSKDNKSANQDNNNTETTKNTKNSKKNKKKEEQASESAKVTENVTDDTAMKPGDADTSCATVGSKKSKAKEAKEKKNKADKKHRNLEDDKVSVQENKEQLPNQGCQPTAGGSLADEVAKARQHIKQSLQCMDGIAALAGVAADSDFSSRVANLEKENQDLRNIVQELRNVVTKLDSRVKSLEQGPKKSGVPQIQICPQKPVEKAAKKDDDDDDDVDLFGSDSEGEDEEAAKIREERLAAYAAKKSKKPALIAKSNIILDIKPWDDETDMKAMEAEVRKIASEGLLWGAAKLAPVAYNIKKLQISCVVEDDKVSIDWLTEQIQEIEDFVQSVDIAAFNKI